MQTVETAKRELQQDIATDSLFGVCKRIGEDLGFNALYLRVAILGLAVVSIPAAASTYVTLGLAVGLSRILFPAPNNEAEDVAIASVSEEQPKIVEQVREPELIAA